MTRFTRILTALLVAATCTPVQARNWDRQALPGQACTGAAIAVTGRTARQVFGTPDDMKFRSSMTLFALAEPDRPAFRQTLERCYGGCAGSTNSRLACPHLTHHRMP